MMQVTCVADPMLDGVMLATAVGQLDANGASRFWEAIPSCLDNFSSVLVDMTEVGSMTSAGIGVLIRVLSRVRPGGGKLAIFGCNPTVRKVLEICRLEGVLNVADTADEARRRLSA